MPLHQHLDGQSDLGAVARNPPMLALLDHRHWSMDSVERHPVFNVRFGSLPPPVILLSISTADEPTLSLVRELRSIDAGMRIVLLLSASWLNANRDQLPLLAREGVSACVPYQSTVHELEDTLRSIVPDARGSAPSRFALDHTSDLNLIDQVVDPARLTPRQLQVLRLLATGLTTAEMARELEVTPRAIEFHRAAIRHRLGISSNAALLRFAVCAAIVLPKPDGS